MPYQKNIAEHIGVDFGTISREIPRNGDKEYDTPKPTEEERVVSTNPESY